jgi:hypothetical protein
MTELFTSTYNTKEKGRRMILYRIVNESRSWCKFEATLGEAHKTAKKFDDPLRVRIERIEVPTSASSVLQLMRLAFGNDSPEVEVPTPVLRSWDLTLRGGLRDLPLEHGL